MLTMTLSGPHGGGGHHGGGHHGGGGFRRGFGPGGGWWPGPYAYGPDVVVVTPASNCQFVIQLPSGAQHVINGPCPPSFTQPISAGVMITAL